MNDLAKVFSAKWYASAMLLCAVIGLTACDAITRISTGTLEVSPANVRFANPLTNEPRQTIAIQIKNVGDGNATVTRVTLTEFDSTAELSILDEGDWAQGTLIPANEQRTLTLAWDILDARADQAELVIEYTDGPPLLVPVTTPDIDPVLTIETEPMVIEDGESPTVLLDQAQPGQTQWARIMLKNNGFAPVNLETLCFLLADGECAIRGESGPFRLCDGVINDVELCRTPMPVEILRPGDQYTASVVFTASARLGLVISIPVLIESNDALAPRSTVRVRAATCVRTIDAPQCGTCGNSKIDGVETCDDGNLENDDGCRNNCTATVCGDGVAEGIEACDDGNRRDDDLCLSDCTLPRCGDGIRQVEREECDDGNDIDHDACRANCQHARCGDGVVHEGVEECDDGNLIETDGCVNQCQLASCGDGLVHAGEEACDDGNDDDTDGCLSDCTLPRCGDGIHQSATEECDDGNDDDTDACLSTCRIATCGDGSVHTGIEACDDGNRVDTDACRNDCTPARCGDGVTAQGIEACDDGNVETEVCAYGLEACIVCDADCTQTDGAVRYCGDNRIDDENGETCDDGNRRLESCPSDTPDCLVCGPACTLETGAPSTCGDGQLDEQREECDDSNQVTERCDYGLDNCMVCSAQCTLVAGETSFCGDGETDPEYETCDDGNDLNDDGCVDGCVLAQCGDGHIQLGVEECDDRNAETEVCDYGLEACTVCTANCLEAPGQTRQCGDHVLEEDVEECDDGNLIDGDGCNGMCAIEQPPAYPEFDCANEDPVPAGIYRYERLPIGGLESEPRTVAYHPSGDYAIIGESHSAIHVYDHTTQTRLRFELNPAGQRVHIRDIEFDPSGFWAFIMADIGPNEGGTIYRFSHANWLNHLSGDPSGTVVEEQPDTRRGKPFRAITYPPTGEPPIVLAASNQQPYIVSLREFDPIAAQFVPGGLQFNAASGAGCEDVFYLNNEFGEPGAFVTCGVNGVDLHYVTQVDGMTEVRDVPSSFGNTSYGASHCSGDYGIMISWAGNRAYRVIDGVVQRDALRKPWGAAGFRAVRFQPGGRRALIFGPSTGNPPVGSVTEFRHGVPDDMALNSVPISNFSAPPYNASRDFNFDDAAFRPGCDEGLLVGSKNGQNAMVVQFRIEGGRRCDP
ncbi:MAG: DUF4215 domain-containing protein [Myxococcota bacterium]|nr:DUF4215 domain-containing protein [Myxococcota bacterium]